MAGDRWSYRGFDLSSGQMRVVSLDGPYALPPLRGSDAPLAGVAGAIWLPKLPDVRRIALDVRIMPTGGAGGDPATIHSQIDTLSNYFGRGSQGALTYYAPDSTVRTGQAEVVSWKPMDLSQIGSLYGGVVDFQLADPWLYTPDVVDTARAIPSSPTSYALVHPGTVAGNRVIFDFLGPITNPRITNAALGIWVEVDVVVAATKHLILDSGAWTAVNDGVNAIGSVTHLGSVPFMYIAPGSNTLSVTGSAMTSATRLTTTFSPPWM